MSVVRMNDENEVKEHERERDEAPQDEKDDLEGKFSSPSCARLSPLLLFCV